MKTCAVCGEISSPVLYVDVDRFQLVQCNRCGVISTSNMSAAEAHALYQEADYHTEKGGSGFEIDGFLKNGLRDGLASYYNRHRFRPLENEMTKRRVKGPKYLDIGCSAGLLLGIARAHGWSVEGVETAPLAAAEAREKMKLTVHQSELENLTLEPGQFDAISLFHVLEHLPDPKSSLKKIRQWLRDDGVLAVEVPNVGSLPARLRKKDWKGYVLPYHLWHFSKHSLRVLFDECGFQILDMHTPYTPCSASHIVNVHQNLSHGARRLLRNSRRSPLGSVPRAAVVGEHLVKGPRLRALLEKSVVAFYWPADMAMSLTGVGESIYVLASKSATRTGS